MDDFAEVIFDFGEWVGDSEWLSDYSAFLTEFRDFFEKLTETDLVECLEGLEPEDAAAFNIVIRECYLTDHGDDQIILEYSDEWNLEANDAEIIYLETIRTSKSSVYEVIEAKPGSHVVLRDLLRGGDPLLLQGTAASEPLVQWDPLFTRVITIEGVTQIAAGTLMISREALPILQEQMNEMVKLGKKDLSREMRKDPIALEKVRDQCADATSWFAIVAWIMESSPGPEPTVINRDGDEMEFISLAFPIKGPAQAIKHALDRAEDFDSYSEDKWAWLQNLKGDTVVFATLQIEGDRLLAECNSGKRGKKLGERLSKLVGSKLGKPLKLKTTIGQAMSLDEETTVPSLDEFSPEEKADFLAHIQRELVRQYMREIDEVVPMLEDRPRDLVKKKEGREQVANWLKMVENSGHRVALELGLTGLDFTQLWTELGILDLRE